MMTRFRYFVFLGSLVALSACDGGYAWRSPLYDHNQPGTEAPGIDKRLMGVWEVACDEGPSFKEVDCDNTRVILVVSADPPRDLTKEYDDLEGWAGVSEIYIIGGNSARRGFGALKTVEVAGASFIDLLLRPGVYYEEIRDRVYWQLRYEVPNKDTLNVWLISDGWIEVFEAGEEPEEPPSEDRMRAWNTKYENLSPFYGIPWIDMSSEDLREFIERNGADNVYSELITLKRVNPPEIDE